MTPPSPAVVRTTLCAMAGLALAACGSGTAEPQATATPTLPTTGTVVPMGMTVDTTKGSVTVHTFVEPAGPGSGGTPFPGDVFAAADVEACGGPTADSRTGITPAAFHLEIGHFSIHPAAVDAREPGLASTPLSPGKCVRGWITFEVPGGSKVAYVIFAGSKVVAWRVP
jgi:uncharacterized protein DUF4352